MNTNMANPESEDPDILKFLSVESGNEISSLESTSAESESVISFVTQIDSTSSRPTTLEKTQSTKVLSGDAKFFSTSQEDHMKEKSSIAFDSLIPRTSQSLESSKILEGKRQEEKLPRNSSDDLQDTQDLDQEKSDGCDDNDDKEEDSYEEDDTTISSEAVVDDIELILMPEMAQDIPTADLSPKLVRVTELKRSAADYEADVFRDEDEDGDSESDFKKMGSDDENYGDDGFTKDTHSSSAGEDEEPNSSRGLGHRLKSKGEQRSLSRGKVNSGVQTDITALENSASMPYEFRRMSSGKSSARLLGVPGKRLNWKSELTLLPSKTKIKARGGFTGYDSINDQDQYSPRVAKFTSQDALSSSSQFLKPSTLYRTRNLSRNLNQCASSESTLVLPMSGLTSSDSPRYRDRITSSTSTANFRAPTTPHSYSSYQISSTARRLQSVSTSSRNLRCSMPDLSSSSKQNSDNRRRQSSRSMKQQQGSACGYKLHKKSSSDDETSSLIDESERCLRSSIDLLLTDDLPNISTDFPYHSPGFGSGSVFGYYSSRRTRSQPILMDEGYGDRDSLGSPFLPRRISEMRLAKWVKIILPNGQVSVVQLQEIDEVRDCITVATDTGCVLNLPFRKVVFAWRIKR